jgi:dienelactone hydrolase
MASVLLLHSVRGLRDVERLAAERWRAEGHAVVTPDLFGGTVPETLDAGFALVEAVGEAALVGRVRAAAAEMPVNAVLAGLSMGAGLAAMPGGPVPETARPETPAQLHLAEPDPFDSEDAVNAWSADAKRLRLAAEVFRYPGSGHLATDPTIEDHDPAGAALLWPRVSTFLAGL